MSVFSNTKLHKVRHCLQRSLSSDYPANFCGGFLSIGKRILAAMSPKDKLRCQKSEPEVQSSQETEKSKKDSPRVIVLWMMMCLLGTTFQFYHVSSLYFSYGITTNVQMVIENNFTPPNTILCFETLQVIQWHKLTHSERLQILQDDLGADIFNYETSDEDNESIQRLPSILKASPDLLPRYQAVSNLQDFNISRIFEVTYKFRDMFDHVAVYLENGSKTGLSQDFTVLSTASAEFYDVFEVTEIFKDMFRCYSLKFKGPVINYYHISRQVGKPGVYAIIMLNQLRVKDTSAMYFVPIKHDCNLTAGFFTGLPVASKTDHIQHMSYNVFESKLLEAPYETRCIEYSNFGLGSRGECFEACIRNESISATGMIHPLLTIYGGETRKSIKLWDIMQNNNNMKTLMDGLADLCDKRCQAQDCQSTLYIPMLLSSVPMDEISLVANHASHSPAIRATCQEAVSLIQYLTDVASTFGFWLGVSAFGFFDILKMTINRLHFAFSRVTKSEVIERVRKQKKNIRQTNKEVGSSWVLVRSPHALPDPGWTLVKCNCRRIAQAFPQVS